MRQSLGERLLVPSHVPSRNQATPNPRLHPSLSNFVRRSLIYSELTFCVCLHDRAVVPIKTTRKGCTELGSAISLYESIISKFAMTHNERRINWIQEGLIGLGGKRICLAKFISSDRSSCFTCWGSHACGNSMCSIHLNKLSLNFLFV